MSLETYPELANGNVDEGFDFRQFWSIIRKRKATFIQIFVLVLVVGAAATVLSKPVYQTRARVLVPAGTSTINVVSTESPINTLMQAAIPESVSTQIQQIQSRKFLSQVMKEAGVKNSPGVVPPSVKVEGLKDTSILQITVTGGMPAVIAQVADKIVELHLEATDELRTTGLQDSLDFMIQETKKADDQLRAANNKLSEFRSTHPVLLGAEEEARLKAFSDAQSAQVAASSNVASTAGNLARVRARLENLPEDLVKPRRKENPFRVTLLEKLRAARAKRVDYLQDYLPDSEEVKEVDAQIVGLQQNLENEPPFITENTYVINPVREALEAEQTGLEANLVRHQESLNAANAQLEVLRGQLTATGTWKPQLDQLTQTVERARRRHEMLSDKLQDLRIRKESRGKRAEVLETASIPSTPIQPKPVTNIALAFVLGLCLATGVVFLQEYLDDRINEPDDLQRLVRLPSLGHVPAISSGDARLVSELASDSHVSEAYRSVRSAIGFAALDGPVRLLQVTSASKGEGKSLTSVNTAMAMAMDGKKVILVDADMRRPSVHRVLELQQAPGLSEVLVGQLTWQEALHPTAVPNLRILCAGTLAPNPAELLGTRAFAQLLEELVEHADIVILDTPPCLPVTDPLIIATRMDAVILVISAGNTRRGAIKHVMGLLARSRARVVGAVFNRVDAKQGGYYYQYYKYYGDGYYSDTGSNGHSRRSRRLPESVSADLGVDETSATPSNRG